MYVIDLHETLSSIYKRTFPLLYPTTQILHLVPAGQLKGQNQVPDTLYKYTMSKNFTEFIIFKHIK